MRRVSFRALFVPDDSNKDLAHNACNDLVRSTKLNNGCESLFDPTEKNNIKSIE